MEYHQRLVRSTSSGAILDYPTNDDWNRLSDLCEVLKPIYIATTLLSNTKYPSLGDVRLTFLGILKNLNDIIDNDQNEQYLIADSVRHKLQIYWNLIKKNTRICSILDPHSKLRLFFNNADISEVNNDVKELITEHISNANNNSHNNNQYPISHHVYFYNLFTTNSDNSNTNDQNNIDEYNNYLNLPSISDNIKVDTLTWWRAHQEEFPTLAKIMIIY
ncbi:13401_t:CDS:2 [Entrophospora sp. SA101]|nr:13401_t:CDS:2 [Entrophospora sp. SA101]